MENNKNKEETKDIDRYEKIVELSRKEIERVWSIYIRLAKALGIIIATGIAIFTYLTWNTVSDMKNSISSEVGKVQQQVNNRIDEEFKTEKIQSLIENKAREYTETTAKPYIATEVNGVMTPFKNKMQHTIDVFYIASHAKSGSKSAFLDLKQYAAKEGTEEAIIARDNLIEIIRDLMRYRSVMHQSHITRMDIYRDVNDGNRVCIQDDSIDKLSNELVVSTDNERQVLMEYISKKPKEEIFKTALKVFESDSLPACAIFCGILFEITEEKVDFLDFDKWTEICKKQVNKQ
jgi:hypothetical protein